MYRNRLKMVQQWEKEGGKPNKADWFTKSGATGVFNVPATKESWLASTVQHVLSTVPGPKGSMILVTERPGRLQGVRSAGTGATASQSGTLLAAAGAMLHKLIKV